MQTEFTIGIEEEFQLVDPATRDLRTGVAEIIETGRKVLGEQLKQEMFQAMIEVVLATLEINATNRVMVGTWREGRTFRVLRREPYETSGAKLLPLHLLRSRGEAQTEPSPGP